MAVFDDHQSLQMLVWHVGRSHDKLMCVAFRQFAVGITLAKAVENSRATGTLGKAAFLVRCYWPCDQNSNKAVSPALFGNLLSRLSQKRLRSINDIVPSAYGITNVQLGMPVIIDI